MDARTAAAAADLGITPQLATRSRRRPFTTQTWRHLMMAHWPLDPRVVREAVPRRLDLDLWEGSAWISVVTCAVDDAAPTFLPKTLALSFLEVTVRTYVLFRGAPGVVLLSRDASSTLAVRASRFGWGTDSRLASISLRRRGGEMLFESHRDGERYERHAVRYRPGPSLGVAAPITLQHFLLERYRAFSVRGPAVLAAELSHPRLCPRTTEIMDLSDQLVAAAGLPSPRTRPPITHYVKELGVETFRPKLIIF
jgi:hypothetical protein